MHKILVVWDFVFRRRESVGVGMKPGGMKPERGDEIGTGTVSSPQLSSLTRCMAVYAAHRAEYGFI